MDLGHSRDDSGRRGLPLVPVPRHELADLQEAAAGIPQELDPLARGPFALLVLAGHAVAPAALPHALLEGAQLRGQLPQARVTALDKARLSVGHEAKICLG